MLDEEAADDFSVNVTDLLPLQVTYYLFDLPKDDQAYHGIPRLHQVHHVEHVVRVTVPGGGARLNYVLPLEPKDRLLALSK